MKKFFYKNEKLVLGGLIAIAIIGGAFIVVCFIKLFFWILLFTFQNPFIVLAIILSLAVILTYISSKK
jgi:hypothetical protein